MTQPALVFSKEPQVEVSTIATSAVLVRVHISTWTGRKRDKKTSSEVNTSKQTTSSRAASVIKNLMTDDPDLDAIRSYAQDTRMWLDANTLGWNDGERLLPSGMIFEVTSELDGRITEYERRVAKFVADYPTKVSAAAFKLGQLFDRAEFPDAATVAHKFNMRYVISPVPTSGDFRVDVQNDVGEYLKKQYEKAADERVVAMMREPWERAYESLAHMRERMDALLAYEEADGDTKRNKPKLFQSVFDNGLELTMLLEKLNVTKDPKLTECATKMRRLFSAHDVKSVRESRNTQESIKKQVDDLMSAFDFTGFDE